MAYDYDNINGPDREKTREQLLEEVLRLRKHIEQLESREIHSGASTKHAGRDIAEMGPIEKQLCESQDMLRLVMDNIPQGIFWKDRNSTYMGCNAVFARTCTLEDPESIKGKTDFDLPCTRDEAEIYRTQDEQAMSLDEPIYHILQEYIDESGEQRWADTSKIPLHDAGGNVVGVLTTYEDITCRKLMDVRLRESEERYRSLVENIGDMIWEIDENLRTIYTNPSVRKLIGYEPEELLGKTPYEFMPPAEAKRVAESLAPKFSRHLPFEFLEHILIRKDGRHIIVESSGVPVFDDNGTFNGYRGVNRDITKRKKAEEALYAREAELNSIFRAAPIGIGLVNDRIIKDVNDRCCQMLGYSRDELLGKNTRMFYPTTEEYEYVGTEKYRQIREKGTGNVEARWVTKDGRIIDVVICSTPVDPDKPMTDTTFTALDITDQKKAKKELVDARAQAELYVDLMGHDINNMNQIAMGYLEMAMDKLEIEGKLALKDKSLISTPIETLANTSRLIGNVRKIQRERAGFYKLRPVNVGEILREAIGHSKPVADRDIRINLDGTADCTVIANELLKDVFLNLLGNAIKHSSGPLNIDIRIECVMEDGREFCKVSVEDDGPGIPEDIKRKLFDRLSLTTAKATGKGFGLCLIKMLVDDFGGKFRVEDRVPGDYSRGAKFVVLLPQK